jgi:PAS domain S-box-containing protein
MSLISTPFRQIANSLDEVFWIYAPHSDSFLYVSPAYERIWMGNPAGLYADSQEWLLPVHDEDRPSLQASIDHLAHGDGYALEYRRTSPDGTQRWIAEKVRPVAAKRGRLPQFAGVSHDITARKTVELELLRSERCKDELLAMLAHELRNPLQPIRWSAAMLARQNVNGPPSERKAIAVIERQVEHLTHLIDDLLDISRLTHDKIRLQSESVCLGEVLETAIEVHRHLAESSRLRLRVDMPDDKVWVKGDAVRLTQVFSNLLHNAIKFSTAGGAIDLWVHGGPGSQQICVSVRDEGAGIRPDLIDSIFDLFTQDDRSPGRNNDGLGIGLSVVRSLVELHDGEVSAHSGGVGKGSEFVVTLPRAPSPKAARPGTPVAPPGLGAVADRRAPPNGPTLQASAAPDSQRVLSCPCFTGATAVNHARIDNAFVAAPVSPSSTRSLQ